MAEPTTARALHARDESRMPPALASASLSALAVGCGWVLDRSGVLPLSGSACLAVLGAAGSAVWAGRRSASARRSRARDEREMEQLRSACDRATRSVEQLKQMAVAGSGHVEWALGEVRARRRPPLLEPYVPQAAGDPHQAAAAQVEVALTEAWQAVFKAAAYKQQEVTEQSRRLSEQADLASILASLVPRLQDLVNRSLQGLLDLYSQYDDPVLLHHLYKLDHLLVRVRREAENQQVIAGHLPSRNVPPVLLRTVLRNAVAEGEQYARVRLAPIEVHDAVAGYISPNLVHLLAALMDNATASSGSNEQVDVFTRRTADGVVVEILDRGPGIPAEKRESLNRLLADPDSVSVLALIHASTLGLLVASRLARQCGITISLGQNVMGGTQACVLIPRQCLTTPPDEQHSVATAEVTAVREAPAPPARTSTAPQISQPEHPGVVTPGTQGRRPLPRRDMHSSSPAPQESSPIPLGPPTPGLAAAFLAGASGGSTPSPGAALPLATDASTQE